MPGRSRVSPMVPLLLAIGLAVPALCAAQSEPRLARAVRLAQDGMGDSARATQYGKRRKEIAAAFNRELWVPAKGLYRDGKPFQTSVKPHQWLPADKDMAATYLASAPRQAAGRG